MNRLILDRRGFMKLSAAAGGVLFLGAGTTACAPSGNGGQGGYSGDVVVTGLASLIHSAPFFIAEAEGFYEEENLQLEHIQFPGGLDAVRGVESGIGLGTTSTIPVFIAAQSGLDVKIIGNVYTAASVDFITVADSPINTIEDVRGKTVGVSAPGSNSTYFAERTLREAGLTPGVDVELVAVGSASDSWTMASRGVIDVAWSASPLSEIIDAESGRKVIWRSRDFVTEWSDTCLVATGDFVDENTEALRAWKRAIGRGMDLISTDLERASEIYGRAIEIAPEIAFKALASSQDFYSLVLTDAQIDAVIAAGKEQGQITREPDVDSIVLREFAA
ncbi:ABC transporter substrate-binding protein [Microbacterium sp. PAMC21962]|nr:ABC transporter substrate-binding protein [Microbacterium sp. PAMC21962]